MMRTTLVAALVLAPLFPAFADGERWEFRVSNVLTPMTPTATVELWAHFDAQDHAFAYAKLDVLASESGWFDPRLTRVPLVTPDATPGVITGAAVEGLIVGQLHTPLHQADPSNPIRLWQADFNVSSFQPRTISLQTDTSSFRVHIRATVPGSESRIGSLMEGAGVIFVVPAPGAIVFPLSLAALAAVRRRRS